MYICKGETKIIISNRDSGETAKEYAYRVIRNNIINLSLKPGEVINENLLSEQLGVSRTPIREALSKLKEQSEIIEIFPRKGIRIALIDTDVVRQVRFLRLTLEQEIIKIVCDKATEKEIIELYKNVELQKFYHKNKLYEEVIKLDNELHGNFFRIAEKDKLNNMIKNIYIHYDRVRNLELSDRHIPQTIEDHENIVDSIKKRDKKLSSELIKKHLDRWLINENALKRHYPEYFKKTF